MKQKSKMSYDSLKNLVNRKPESVKLLKMVDVNYIYFHALNLAIYQATDPEGFDFILVLKLITDTFVILDVEKI